MAAAEIAFLVRELQLRANSRVLDVPCGFGRHALALATEPSCEVDGIDLSAELDSAMTFERGGVVQRATASHHVHTVAELLAMLRDAGLEPLATYGAPDGAPYALGSPRLLVVSQRTR